MKSFLVVGFVEEESVAVVPSKWITENKDMLICAWPPFKNPERIKKAIIHLDEPNSTWNRFQVKLIYEADSYDKARQKLGQAEYMSDLQSEADEGSGKRIRVKRQLCSSSDEEENGCPSNLPLPPKFIKTEPSVKTNQNSRNEAFQSSSPSPLQSIQLPLFELQALLSQNTSGPSTSYTTPSSRPKGHSETLKKLSTAQRKPLFGSQPGPSTHHGTTSPGLQTRDETFQEKVLRLLETISRDVKDLQKCRLGSVSTPAGLPHECPALPAQQVEELADLENFIKIKDNFDKVCAYLATTGGCNTKDCTKRILPKVISNRLSTKYNWKGSRGVKLPFSSLPCIIKLISDAVRLQEGRSNATDFEILEVIKKWLMHSADRDGGRNEKKSQCFNVK